MTVRTEIERLTKALADHYRIEHELGRGGMATVYLATDPRHARRVAIKVLRPELASTLGSDRFLREIAITARLDHPGIVPLLDSGYADGFLYYAMPYVEGEALRACLTREKQLAVDRAVQIASEVADALGYAHKCGVVHRDIKPENVLLSAGHARIADFGIARAIAAATDNELTVTGIAIGTPTYMSPEQASGSASIDGRSDLYSLGCVLYEMLAGEPPFTAETPRQLLARKALDSARSLRLIRPSVPRHVELTVRTAMEPAPADRHTTAEEFASALHGDGRSVRLVRYRASRWWRMTVPATMALALTVAAAKLVLDSSSGATVVAPIPSRIAVFPFRVDDPAHSHLSEGIMALLSDAIDGAGSISRIDPNVLTSAIASAGNSATPDLTHAGAIAAKLGAGRFILGRVVPTGHSVQLLASLYAGSNAREPEHTFRYEGAVDSISSLITALARDVLLRVPTGPGTWVTDASAPVTADAAALREYMRGEAYIRRAFADSASIALRKAIALDSTFALAWLRLAFASDFAIQDSAIVTASDRALELADRLGPRDKLLAEVMERYAHGDAEGAERVALALTSAYPEYGEGWYRLGLVRHWHAWQRGAAPIDAEPALERAVAIDPHHPQALYALSWIATTTGRFARADSFDAARGRARWRILRDTAAFPAFLKTTSTARSGHVIGVTTDAAWNAYDRLYHADQLARLLTDARNRSPRDVMIGHVLRARIAAAAGRWDEAERSYAAADSAGFGLGLLEASWLAAVPILGVTEHRRRALRDSLIGWSAPADLLTPAQLRPPYYFPALIIPDHWLLPHLRRYVLGLLNAGLGAEELALRNARQLVSAAETNDTIGLLRDLSFEIRAMAAIQRGDDTTALSLLDSATLTIASHYQIASSFVHMRPVNRLLRGELLARMGRHREAIGWLSAIGWGRDAHECVFLAHTHLRLGELHEQLGDPTQALYHYGRFVARWQRADTVHQGKVEETRRRVARLRGQRSTASR